MQSTRFTRPATTIFAVASLCLCNVALERKRLQESGWFNNSKRQRVIVKLQQNTPPNVVGKLQQLRYGEYPASIVCPPRSPSYTPLVAMNLCRKPVFFTGNYLKLQRGLSQTPWWGRGSEVTRRIVDGERKTEGSVEEFILGTFREFMKSDGMKFHSAGREDVDGRMLCEGRPFVVEVDNARRCEFSPEEYAVGVAEMGEGSDCRRR